MGAGAGAGGGAGASGGGGAGTVFARLGTVHFLTRLLSFFAI